MFCTGVLPIELGTANGGPARKPQSEFSALISNPIGGPRMPHVATPKVTALTCRTALHTEPALDSKVGAVQVSGGCMLG